MVFVLAGCLVSLVAPTVNAGDSDIVALTRTELSKKIQAAPLLKPEDLGSPMRSYRGVGGRIFVPNKDGKTYDFILHYIKNYWGPHTLISFDMGTGKTYVQKYENVLSNWEHLGSNNQLYNVVGGKIEVYNPDSNTWRSIKAPEDLGGEVMPMCDGPDGMIYGAGSKDGQAVIYKLDIDTDKVTPFGKVGPSHAPNGCWGYSVAADDEYVYVASGKIPWYLVAYKISTGKSTVLYTNKTDKGHLGVGNDKQYNLCTAYSNEGDKRIQFWLYHGVLKSRKPEDKKPPFDVTLRKSKALPPRPKIAIDSPDAKGDGTFWYLPAGSPDVTDQEKLANADPESLGWKKVDFKIQTFPYPVVSLTPMNDGRILGSGGSYIGNFLYDPQTGQAKHMGRIGLSQGCGIAHEGKFYLSGYPSSPLYEYDPDKPWTAHKLVKPWEKPITDQDPSANPCLKFYMRHTGSGCHRMLGAASGKNGYVYFGGNWYRDGNGGGFAWYNPETKDGGGLYKPLANYQVKYLSMAGDGRYVVLSTSAVRGALDNSEEPASARLFVFDTTTKTLSHSFVPVENAKLTGPILEGPGNTVIGMTYNPQDRLGDEKDKDGINDKSAIIYKVDVITGKMIWKKLLPYPVGFRTNENAKGKDGFAFIKGPDGWIWTYTGGKMVYFDPEKPWHNTYRGKDLAIIRINPANGDVDVVGRIDHPSAMAFSGKDLILGGGDRYLLEGNTAVRRLRNMSR